MIEKLIGVERIAKIEAELGVHYDAMIDNMAKWTMENFSTVVGIVILIIIAVKLYRFFNNLKYIGKSDAEVKGMVGEDTVYRQLNSIKGKKYILRNVYLPTYSGHTELDMILIHKTGIYAVEVKNYSGEVWGSLEEDQWKHALGDNVFMFYNPIKQNKGHIHWLNKNTNFKYKDYIKSFIVFGNVNYDCDNYYDGEYCDLILTDVGHCNRAINFINDINLSDVEIEEIYKELSEYTKVSAADKKKHIKDIQKKYS